MEGAADNPRLEGDSPMTFRFRGPGVAVLAAFAGFWIPSGATALTFTVDSTADIVDASLADGVCAAVGGGCTLRAAVMQANVAGGLGATIVLPAGTYLLYIPVLGSDGDWEGDLNLKSPTSGSPTIQIVGAGAATTIIDPGGLSRAFEIESLRGASITGVTIRNGYLLNDVGGGILNAGSLALSRCVMTGNWASSGGAIWSSGALAVTATQLSGNEAFFIGGGIDQSGGSLTISESELAGNTALDDAGGGLAVNFGTVLVDRTTISGNFSGSSGGGIAGYSSSFLVRESTISGNRANTNGGGIITEGPNAVANVYSTTIVFNESDADADEIGGSGGGVYSGAGSFNIRNTLIAGNYTAGAPVYDDCAGTIGSYGMNLFTSAASICNLVVGLGGTGYLSSLDAIGPLQHNGGPTRTRALLAGSNAIDGTLPAYGCVDEASQPLLTDQRGVPRALGLRCDIGAFESGEIFADGFELGDSSRWL